MTDDCKHCGCQLHWDGIGWIDNTSGDVCGWNGGNEPHEPYLPMIGEASMKTFPCPNCSNPILACQRCVHCGHIDAKTDCNCSHCKWLQESYGKCDSASSESLPSPDITNRKEAVVCNRFGTMGSIRGNETLVIGPDDETVCVCEGENHADTADKIARLLEQDSDPTGVLPLTLPAAVVMLLLTVLLVAICAISSAITSPR